MRFDYIISNPPYGANLDLSKIPTKFVSSGESFSYFIEFCYRLLKKADIYINKNAQVDHNFDGFKKTARNFLKRGYMWFQMFLKRKKFDNVGTTQGTAFFRGFAFLSLILLISSLFYFNLIYLAALSFIISIFGNIKFYRLILKETNIIFLLKAIFVDYILSILLGISAVAAIITYPFKAKNI